ncbi:hypothetical protein X275_05770 [Marinitoga sp. 1197]|uniref:HAD family hydrolase n=1 Tax=unclassified Marinitoga TaxID=2640159 RepID=UPI000641363C|nr:MULTISPECIES: HAD hydrolase-like protein [unclassified Marinitoga]KLO22560.1 hypothetical protein X275_05770 [Marinitoga sp. 1197]NUU99887.1 hypothetical protein [Marinitoga sp. 1154]
MKYKHLFFDMDGTLFDTSEGIIFSMQEAFKKNNLEPLSRDEILKLIGPTLDEIMDIIFGIEDNPLKFKIRKDFRELYAEKGVYMLNLYPYVLETLEELYNKNNNMYIITSKPEIFANKILKKFKMDKYFKKVVGVPLEGNVLPKKNRLKKLITELEISSNSSVMIGDTKSDIDAAKYNNIDMICVSYGFCQNKSNFNNCTVVINKFNELLKIVE